MNDPLILYILCRSDLASMGKGKGMAQAAHAASLFSENEIVKPLLAGVVPSKDAMEWRQGEQEEALGFGTKLTIEVPSLEVLETIVDTAQSLDFPAGLVIDPTYPFIVPNELVGRMDQSKFTLPPHSVSPAETVCFVKETTTGYVFGRKSRLSILLSRFKLVPNE